MPGPNLAWGNQPIKAMADMEDKNQAGGGELEEYSQNMMKVEWWSGSRNLLS